MRRLPYHSPSHVNLTLDALLEADANRLSSALPARNSSLRRAAAHLLASAAVSVDLRRRDANGLLIGAMRGQPARQRGGSVRVAQGWRGRARRRRRRSAAPWVAAAATAGTWAAAAAFLAQNRGCRSGGRQWVRIRSFRRTPRAGTELLLLGRSRPCLATGTTSTGTRRSRTQLGDVEREDGIVAVAGRRTYELHDLPSQPPRLTALLLLCRWLSLGRDFGGGLRVEYVRMEDVSDDESRRAWLCGLIRRHPTLRKCCDGSDEAVARAATVAASIARRRSRAAGDNRSAPAVARRRRRRRRHPPPIVEQCCAARGAARGGGCGAQYTTELTTEAPARINEVSPALLRRLGYAPQGR